MVILFSGVCETLYCLGGSEWLIAILMWIPVVSAILTIKSQSVWPAAFLHAAHNAYDQAVFGVITLGDDKMYYVSETGCITILCVWVIAIIMLCFYRPWKDVTAL